MWIQLMRSTIVNGQHYDTGERVEVGEQLGTSLSMMRKARRSFPPPPETLLEPASPPGNNPDGALAAAAVVEVIEDEAVSEVAALTPTESAVLPKAKAKKSK